ncbi:Rib protein [Lactobacillus equicursoris DSM 19284 = JCM 14600 = CIP 110162]|nr:Rib/alpha-like domain-containing protein [Lactobacillus equicursoris]CCK86077.1 Rib protein [Lactobacillus equicursoris DSM 19284 = JCM 14600 = CIP 110162]
MKTFSKLAVLSASACLLSLSAGQVQASQADEYSPEVKKVRVQEGNYLIARDLVKNASKLPENTIYGFVHEPNFLKAGTYRTRIRILYPDDSTEETRKAKVHVKSASDAQRYQPVVTGRTIAFGKAFKSKRLVTNKKQLPKKTSYRFTAIPNFKKAGTYWTRVKVTYPDKSKEESAWVKVVVLRQKDSDKYQVHVKGKTTYYGKKLTAKSLVTNAKKLPKKTKYYFTMTPNFYYAGTYYSAVKAVYPDGTADVSRLAKVVVKSLESHYQVKAVSKTTSLGRAINPKNVVTNVKSLPKGTTFAFDRTIHWNKTSKKRVKVIAIYPDQSRDLSNYITVTIKDNRQAVRYKPVLISGQTRLNVVLPAKSLVKNLSALPKRTQVSYVTSPNFNQAGSCQVKIKITYPDKSSKTYGVIVTVIDPAPSQPSGESSSSASSQSAAASQSSAVSSSSAAQSSN